MQFGAAIKFGILAGLALCIGCGEAQTNPKNGAGNSASKSGGSNADGGETTAGKSGSLDLQAAFDKLLTEKTLERPPQFQQVATEVGVSFTYYNDAREQRYYFPEILGGGIAALDYDLDGRSDLYFSNGRGMPIDNDDDQHFDQVFRRITSGSFENTTSLTRIKENRYSHGCAYGDLNADGFDDIAIAGFSLAGHRGVSVYLNQGDGTFVRTADDEVNIFPTWSTCPLITDLNDDGISDLIVVNYVGWTYNNEACHYDSIRGYCGPGQFQPLRNYVFINDGQGSFTEQGEELGFKERGKGLAMSAVDFDQDLKPEIYIANDLVVNFLYEQDPKNPGHYVDAGGPRGVAVAESGFDEASMSVTPADYDRNGFADLFVTNYYKQKNTLYLNRDGKRFTDSSFAARTHATGELFLGFGALALDYDKDGWTDVFVGNGHVIGPEHNPNQMTNQLLRNNEGVFEDVSSSAGPFFEVKTLSRGSAIFDLDDDLDTDIVVNHIDRPISLLRNETDTDLHAISVMLVSPQHQPLEGSRIDVQLADSKQTIPVSSGGSYLSDPERKWIVGTGTQQQVSLTIYWRDGQVDQWSDLPVDLHWRFAPGRKWSSVPKQMESL